MTGLLEEDVTQTLGGSRPTSTVACSSGRFPQRVQQPGDAERAAVEIGVGGGIAGRQRGDLIIRSRLAQRAQQQGDGERNQPVLVASCNHARCGQLPDGAWRGDKGKAHDQRGSAGGDRQLPWLGRLASRPGDWEDGSGGEWGWAG
jgi:hypothetical protein